MKPQMFFLTVLLLSLSAITFAQSKDWHVRASLDGSYNWFGSTSGADGGSSFDDGGGAFSYGASAEVSLNVIGKTEVLLGVSYTRLRGMTHPALFAGPDYVSHKNLFTIPLQYRFRFWDYFFIDGGVFLDILSRDSYGESYSSGDGSVTYHKHPYYVMMGPGIGIGAEYIFPSGIFITLHPNIRWSGFGYDNPTFRYKAITLKAGYRF
jgi:hypothetical protein